MMSDSTQKTAPVQMPHHGRVPHGIRFRIPWRIHQRVWEEYSKHFRGQSAETIAARGGFGLEEVIYFLAGENPFSGGNVDGAMATDFFNKWPEGDVDEANKSNT